MVRPLKAAMCILAAGVAVGGLFQGLRASASIPEQAPPLKLVSLGVSVSPVPLPGHLAETTIVGRGGVVEIAIDRWSSDEERGALLETLANKGAMSLQSALRETKPVGLLRAPDHSAWDLHFAQQRPTADGGRDVVIATDRAISYWGGANSQRVPAYPFTVIEIHLDKNGKGLGKMSMATRVVASQDGKALELERYSTQPVLLEAVAVQR
ncbi:MAG TPA: hypothetical protein VF173_16325 [Thermoanaerobaculia bacterium]|nr:hypothetical protein [Thermoanaerobaculia bacterium]